LIYDVIVVGAGPSGSVTAKECSKAGFKTLLLDKNVFPRRKICAGGVTKAAAVLLGERIPPDIIESRCKQFFCIYKELRQRIKLHTHFMSVVSRAAFDNWLLQLNEKVGTVIGLGEEVKEVQPENSLVKVLTKEKAYRGKVVVGADGVNSIVARKVRPPFKKNELAFYACAEIPVNAVKFSPDKVIIHFNFPDRGYGWIFPGRKFMVAGVGGHVQYIHNVKDEFYKFLSGVGIKGNYELRGQYVPIGGIKRKIVADRVILVGDAAGFADPLSGEGIRYAVASGKEAACIIKKVFAGDKPPSAKNLAEYQQVCGRFIEKELSRALKISKFLGRCPEKILKYCFRCREPFERFLDISLGESSYTNYIKWLALWLPRQPIRRMFVN